MSATPPTSRRPTEPVQILVIEDNEDLAFGLSRSLEAEGYDVLVANDGKSGIALAGEHRPAMVILDLMLPGIDGYATLEALRAAGLTMPVLILTARGGETDKVHGLRIGADDYVTKPFSLSELLARVAAHLRRARAGGARQRPEISRFGSVEVNRASHTVTRRGVYLLLVAAVAGHRLRSTWRDSVASLDDQLTRSLVVTRGEVEAWVQRHAAFVSVAAGFLDAGADLDHDVAQLGHILREHRAYDGAWLLDDRGVRVASWPTGMDLDAPGPQGATGEVAAGRCAAGFCAYFAGAVAGAPRALRLVVRAPIGDETFPQLNPTRSTVRTGRTLILARMEDSVVIVARRGGEDSATAPRAFSARELPSQVREALSGGAPHGSGIGIGGAEVIYAMTSMPGAGWAMARELEVSELRDGYRRRMLISESIVAELLRSGALRTPEEAERALGIIEKEAKRLTILVDNVLNFTSIRKRAESPKSFPATWARRSSWWPRRSRRWRRSASRRWYGRRRRSTCEQTRWRCGRSSSTSWRTR